MLTGLVVAVLCGAAVLVSGVPHGRRAAHAGVRNRRTASGPVRAGHHARPDAALLLELLAAMLDAGVSPDVGLALLSQLHPHSVGPALARVVAGRRLGADWPSAVALAARSRPGSRDRAAPEHREALAAVGPLLEAVVFAATTGAPSAGLLRSRAGELRTRRRQETERRAASLGVRLVLPLGLCQLPAFICLGIVPVVLALLPALGS
ncbi:type II secretion system F family protein [Tersicoccus sp. MR15.9]|uniref:type II secretion system F family protein n=1 Tax=Tersicoccus mangrovi TaxID=3121635 RepID=UPI002FE6A057